MMSEYEHLTKVTNILQIIEIVLLIFAVIAIVFAIVFFFKYKIPNVIMEISGKQKQKQLEKMHADKSATNSNDYHIGFSGELSENKSSIPRKNNGTINKNSGSANKKRETSLAKKERRTALMEKRETLESQKKTHQTVALNHSREHLPDLKVIDEIVLFASNEVIE
ncbi:MAG: hypothetical protein ACI4HZ_02210 [Ruminococcus sp.]